MSAISGGKPKSAVMKRIAFIEDLRNISESAWNC